MTNIPEGFQAASDRELGWEDEIEKETVDYVLLPEGDYDFEVVDFERGRHPGSDKLPPCNKAIVKIRIEGRDMDGHEGVCIINHQLFLHTKTEGLLCAFFKGIGQKKKGEKVRMNWSAVPGSRGRAKVGIREYQGRSYNEIKQFYEYEGTAAPQVQQETTYEKGKF